MRTTGKTLQERHTESVIKSKEKAQEKNKSKGPVSYTTAKQHTPIKRQTSKEAGVKSSLSSIKQEIRLEAIQNNEYFCKGCGMAGGMDCSHILSVGQYKPLELIKENIQLLCRDCHRVWESAPIEEQMALHCFADNLAFIYSQDRKAYQKFVTRIEEFNKWLVPGTDCAKIKAVGTFFNKMAHFITNYY